MKRSLIFSRFFWIILGIKIIFGTFFASAYMTKGFIPFVNYFIVHGKNPYDYFYHLHTIVFPYPSLMLLLFSCFAFLGKLFFYTFWLHNIFFQLFLMRIPILLADVILYVLLCLLLPAKEKKVLFLYFASPILFYINYYHGQLDSIPTTFLFLSLFVLFKDKKLFSFILLGLGIATKTHLLIVLPFYFVYLVKMHYPIKKLVGLSFISLSIFCVINVFFYSSGFLHTVFQNQEQQRLLFLTMPFGYNNVTIFIAPAVLLGILYKFSSYKKLNADSLILSLGLVFTVLIALVPPMQGWFYWSLPFLVYFFIKYTKASAFSFWMMHIFYLLFFTAIKESDIWQSASLIFTKLHHMPTPFYFLLDKGINPLIVQNTFFTGLEISVLMNVVWCYQIGMHYNNIYIAKDKPFLCGIAGDSGTGKSTLTQAITEIVGTTNIAVLNGDDTHKWERGNAHWKILTHLNPKSNHIHTDQEQVYALSNGRTIQRAFYNHKTGIFSHPVTVSPNRFIILQGLHPFFIKDMRSIYDLKIYLEVSAALRKRWKVKRDMQERGHKKTFIEKELKRRQPDFKKFIQPQKAYADWIIHYDIQDKHGLQITYFLKNTLPIEQVITALEQYKSLHIQHEYSTMEYQKVSIQGTIAKEKLRETAYRLYPNISDILNNQPIFYNDSKGIQQLFFLTIINHYYLQKKQHAETVY